MNELEYAPAYLPQASDEERTKLLHTGDQLRGRTAAFWCVVGLGLVGLGGAGVYLDITRPALVSGVLDFVAGLFSPRLDIPTYTPYLALATGAYLLFWSGNLVAGRHWAWLVALWFNALAAFLWLIGAIYLAQVSWPGFRVGSLEISRLWLVGLMALEAVLFGWVTLLFYTSKLGQSYYQRVLGEESTVHERSREMMKALSVCSLCGQPVDGAGRCRVHSPAGQMTDLETGTVYELRAYLKDNFVFIGRSKGTLQLDPAHNPAYESISNPHLELYVDDEGHWFLRDLSHHRHPTEKRTWVSGQALPLPGQNWDTPVGLHSPEEIKLGKASFRFEEN